MAQRGRKPKANPVKAPQDTPPIAPQGLAELIGEATDEERSRLRQAIWDRACGYKLLTRVKKVGSLAGGVLKYILVAEDARDGDEMYVYEIPGDATSQKLLIEHTSGRPGVRQSERTDPEIKIIHRVPGKRDWGTTPEQAAATIRRRFPADQWPEVARLLLEAPPAVEEPDPDDETAEPEAVPEAVPNYGWQMLNGPEEES